MPFLVDLYAYGPVPTGCLSRCMPYRVIADGLMMTALAYAIWWSNAGQTDLSLKRTVIGPEALTAATPEYSDERVSLPAFAGFRIRAKLLATAAAVSFVPS